MRWERVGLNPGRRLRGEAAELMAISRDASWRRYELMDHARLG